MYSPKRVSKLGTDFPKFDPGMANLFPSKQIRMNEDVTLIFEPNRYTTRSFETMFRIYTDKEFSRKSPDGIYTWLLASVRDEVFFVTTQAYNTLEVHAKHASLAMKFKEKYAIKDQISIIAAGELEKLGESVRYNFASGTYMQDLELSQEAIANLSDFVTYVLRDKLHFAVVEFIPSYETMIPKMEPKEVRKFVRSIGGGVRRRYVSTKDLKKLERMYRGKLQVRVDTLERMKARGFAVDEAELQGKKAELAEIAVMERDLLKPASIRRSIRKYERDGRGRKQSRSTKGRSKGASARRHRSRKPTKGKSPRSQGKRGSRRRL